MSADFNRRGFLKKSVFASTGAALGLSLEEKALIAQSARKPAATGAAGSPKGMPTGKIGNITISRMFGLCPP